MSERRPLKIALAGTRGVPANYGGFETAVEEVGSRLADRGHTVRVYARSADPSIKTYRGMEVVHKPALRRKSLETLSHSVMSLPDIVGFRPDATIFFNAANAIPASVLNFFRLPYAIHVDGLEWKRSKWGPVGRNFYLASERIAVRTSQSLIADAKGIADYYESKFNQSTVNIAYGTPNESAYGEYSTEFGVVSREYFLVVARLEPENNVQLIVDAYSRSPRKYPLIVVGAAPYGAQHTKVLHESASPSVSFVGGVYDQDKLTWLYENALVYLHGHSVGGTNPSLLRAGVTGSGILAFDTEFNREVLEDGAGYFRDIQALDRHLVEIENSSSPLNVLRGSDKVSNLRQRYNWEAVASAYEDLCWRLCKRR